MPTTDLVSIGLTILDILGRPVDRLPEGGRVELIQEIRWTAAGSAAACAVIASRLGLQARLAGGIGNDDLGAVLRGLLAREGVDLSLVQSPEGARTSATLLPIRSNGDRPALHAPGASLALRIPEDPEPWLDTRFLHLGGIGTLPFIDGEPSVALLSAAKERGVVVTCDLIAPNQATRTALEAALPFIDYFMPTLDEAYEISGEREPKAAAGWFADRGARACIFKDGPRGSLWIEAGREERIPAFAVDVVDTTGCGDSYCGGFIAALAHGLDTAAACRFASATAALVATGLGSDAGVVDWATTERHAAELEALPTA